MNPCPNVKEGRCDCISPTCLAVESLQDQLAGYTAREIDLKARLSTAMSYKRQCNARIKAALTLLDARLYCEAIQALGGHV